MKVWLFPGTQKWKPGHEHSSALKLTLCCRFRSASVAKTAFTPLSHIFFFFFEKCRVSPTYDTNTNLYQSNIKIRLSESLPRGKASFLPLKRFNK